MEGQSLSAIRQLKPEIMTEAERQAVRQDTIKEVQELLLKQLWSVRFENGYGIQACPKSTILSLPALMNLEAAKTGVNLGIPNVVDGLKTKQPTQN
jgi:hypothetical protein